MKSRYTHLVRCVLFDRGDEFTTVYDIAKVSECGARHVHSAISCLRINGEIEGRTSSTFCKANHRPVQEFRLRDRAADPRAGVRELSAGALTQAWTGVRDAGA